MDAWVVVVDDDVSNLKMAGYILSKNNMRVTALKSHDAGHGRFYYTAKAAGTGNGKR